MYYKHYKSIENVFERVIVIFIRHPLSWINSQFSMQDKKRDVKFLEKDSNTDGSSRVGWKPLTVKQMFVK